MDIDRMTFRILAGYIEKLCGLILDDSKTYLIENRLSPLVESLGCKGLAELYQRAVRDETHEIDRKIVDLITTPETAFFRDPPVFEALRYRILPDVVDNKRGRGETSPTIRFWSAGCSTGQEVYSIIMAAHEMLHHTGIEFSVLGTDISATNISRASAGIYSDAEVRKGLNPRQIETCFQRVTAGWKIRDELRSRATFNRLNLLESLAGIGRFDIVFCRNVSIYFSPDVKTALYQRIARVMMTDGFLVLGSAESLFEPQPLFKPKRHLKTLFYQRTRELP
jgi:chemotaxis protein methyltransferase CheR